MARRWDTFAAQELEPQLVSELLAAVMISEHEVRSTPVDLGAGRRIGFTGRAVFSLDRESAQGEVGVLFAALSRFAEAAGVGAQTTHGLGWVQVGLEDC